MSGVGDRDRAAVPHLGSIAWRSIQLGLLFGSRLAGSAVEAMRRQATKIEARLEGLNDIAIKAIADIPAPRVDLGSDNPIAPIMASIEFAAATAFFANNPVVQ